MKNIILTLSVLLFVTNSVMAQEQDRLSFFSISTGYASFNGGQQGGMFLTNNYIRNTNTLFTYGVKLIFAHGEGDVEGLQPWHDTHISTSAIDISGYIYPIRSSKHLLSFGLGFSFDYRRTSYLSNTDFVIIDNEYYMKADTDGMLSFIMPVLDLYYYCNLKNNIFIGIHCNARNFDQSLFGLSGGIRF